MRSSVWQPTQFRSDDFCSSLPGMLAIHSALESWEASRLVLTSFRSAVAALAAATSAAGLLLSSYPVARMVRRMRLLSPCPTEMITALAAPCKPQDGVGHTRMRWWTTANSGALSIVPAPGRHRPHSRPPKAQALYLWPRGRLFRLSEPVQ